MVTFKRLDHLQICIPKGKEDEAREFYTGILGLREIPKPAALIPNGGLWYQLGDIQLHIGTEDGVAPSKRHPAFEITDVPAARKLLEDHGIKIKDEIEVPGVNRFSFFDPFGNRIELLSLI